jgi:hypothetical protein
LKRAQRQHRAADVAVGAQRRPVIGAGGPSAVGHLPGAHEHRHRVRVEIGRVPFRVEADQNVAGNLRVALRRAEEGPLVQEARFCSRYR